MNKKIELRRLLLESEKYPWDEYIYMSKEERWTLNSSCYLFNLNELAYDEDDPPFAIENNLKCVLSVGDIQDIVLNLKEQKETCSVQELFNAFIYYLKNDAFFEYGDE